MLPHLTHQPGLLEIALHPKIRPLHDTIAIHTEVGVQFYLDEINRREQNKQTDLMVKYTKQMLWLTIFVAALTVINVIAVIFPLSCHP